MQEGRFTKKDIDWGEWLSPRLYINPRRVENGHFISCATSALSLLTGIQTKLIEPYCPRPYQGWSTARAIRFLKEKGYKTLKVTKSTIVNAPYYKLPLKPDHCLLLNLRLDKHDNSMMILHKNVLWHNFYVEKDFNGLYFLNKPTQDVVIVTHPKWQ